MPGWVAVAGDWDGDGRDSVGVFDPGTATWYLRNTNSPGAPDVAPFAFGMPGVVPVAGDWDGNGTTTVGVFDPEGQFGQPAATWYLRNSNTPGSPDIAPFAFGTRTLTPVTGDWDRDGTTTVGVFDPEGQFGRPATWYLRNSNTPGAPAVAPFAYGVQDWAPVLGSRGAASLALRAAGGQAAGPDRPAALTPAAAQAFLLAATHRTRTAGSLLAGVRVEVRDLPSGYLAFAHPETRLLELDEDAAGHGWFLDPTPRGDEEFSGSGGALPGSRAAGRMDLLTAMLHELWAVAGLGAVPGGGLPAGELAAGVRRTAHLDAVFGELASR
jgi:hypothetical protein